MKPFADDTRALRVDVNLRGRDLVSWVREAQAVVGKEIPLSSGYRVEWGGQFENFERAKKRLTLVVPAAVATPILRPYWGRGRVTGGCS